ncbi:MAG: pyridoxal phosphate-dependent aminotransferase [Armatimonadetes bacterium]|nr:pyridoxal phosphate-dependent aminotransferase [Armatimonadota bacterium]
MKDIKKSLIRQIFDSAPKNSINFGLGEIQFPTPKILCEYAKKILDDRNIRYTPNAGLFELREAISNYYQNIIPAENVCVTCGAEEAVYATLASILNPEDEVLLANPCFLAYGSIIEMLYGIPVYFDLDPRQNFMLDKKSFLNGISQKTKAVLLNNPSNPLGIILSKDEIKFILETCHKHNILIIVDEIYRDLFLNEKTPSFLEITENIIVISGVSKSHCMTGWRLGWVASHQKDVIEKIITAHQYICTCAPFLSQKVAVKAFSEEGMKSAEEIRKKLKRNYEFLIKYFDENHIEYKALESASSPYFFVNFGIDDRKLSIHLLENGVIVISGTAFGSNGKNWVRINYGVERAILKKGLKIIIQILKKKP